MKKLLILLVVALLAAPATAVIYDNFTWSWDPQAVAEVIPVNLEIEMYVNVVVGAPIDLTNTYDGDPADNYYGGESSITVNHTMDLTLAAQIEEVLPDFAEWKILLDGIPPADYAAAPAPNSMDLLFGATSGQKTVSIQLWCKDPDISAIQYQGPGHFEHVADMTFTVTPL